MNLTTTDKSPPKLPKPMHPAVESSLSAGLAALEDGSLHREVVPSGVLVSLRIRRSDLEAALAPAPRKWIAMVLASLGRMAESATANADEASALIRQDIEDLSDVSPWALEAAARAYRKAEVGDGKWRPTAGQLRKEARRREAGARADLYRIGKLLDAPSLTAPKPVFVSKERIDGLQAQIAALGKVDAA